MMTRGARLRRRMRARRGKRAAASVRRAAYQAGRSVERAESPAARRRFWQAAVCGVLFAVLVLLKLALPGNLAAFRGTLAEWLVRDADFAAAFSAVGHAVAEPGRFVEAMGDAYIAVFGEEPAREVSGAAEDAAVPEDISESPELPDYVLAEQPTLPFSFCAPLAGTLTSPFGWREDPNSGVEAFHAGIDLAATEGTRIACFADGTVGVVGESTVLGNYVTVQHAEGYETLYAHCSKIGVSSGQRVARGETLGEVGATGNATGAHLHFELLYGSKYVDPLAYVQTAA